MPLMGGLLKADGEHCDHICDRAALSPGEALGNVIINSALNQKNLKATHGGTDKPITKQCRRSSQCRRAPGAGHVTMTQGDIDESHECT